MMLQELRCYPFTKGSGTFIPPEQVAPHIQRRFLRNKLDCNREVTLEDIEFVREHPEHAKWVKAKVDDKAWRRVAELVEWVEWQEIRSARDAGSASED
jgi:hypothetical protein